MVIKRYISLNYKFAKAKYLYQYHKLTMFLKCLPILDNRFLYCDFWIYDEPELIHEIFSQFNETNNKFYEVFISKAYLTNFVFDENTTGKLIMEKFIVSVDMYIQNDPPVQFKETAFENSNSVLGAISVNSPDPYFPMNYWNFGQGTLDNLKNLNHLELFNYNYDTEPFPPSVLFTLQDLSFKGDTQLSSFSYVAMPNLKNLNLYYYLGSSLPPYMLYNLPGLETFMLGYSVVETIPDGFFTYATSCENLMLYGNFIHYIDLGGLNPSAWVDLSYNQINKLQEKNFRPFVENVLYTSNANGTVLLDGNPLECSCDIKWLVVELRDGLQIFQNAQCADGRALADVDPVLLEIECPDY